MLRIAQLGQGAPRVVVFCFLVDATIMGDKLRAAFGPEPMIVTDADSHGRETMAELLAFARAKAEIAGYALVGYSNGGQRVRGLLHAGADPCAVVIIDGTHDSIPASHLETWRAYGDKARARERLFVATCTQQTYTDDLSQTERYLCTRHTLEEALGLVLPPNTEAHDGELHVKSYPSKRIDGPAHIAQAQVAMPDMCRTYLAPWVRGWLKPNVGTSAEVPTEPAVHNEPLTPLGERCVLWCENELARGIHEEPPGSNTGPRIRDYLAPGIRNGKLLGLRAGAWCAAAQCCAMRECLAPGETPVHPYRVSGLEMESDARGNGTWQTTRPKRGDLVILRRGTGWERHVARVRTVGEHDFTTIAGNEGDRWAISAVRFDDDRILGYVRFS